MNGRITIITQASVMTVIRTRSATDQSRMMRITRTVQNGTSIEGVGKATPKAAFKAGPKSALGPSLGSVRRARQRHHGRSYGSWMTRYSALIRGGSPVVGTGGGERSTSKRIHVIGLASPRSAALPKLSIYV